MRPCTFRIEIQVSLASSPGEVQVAPPPSCDAYQTEPEKKRDDMRGIELE